jgi:phosphoglycolate phosphatase-like HAD superfamily hydrolase
LINLIHYSAVLFDFDGTLVDSWPGVYDAYVQGFRYFNPAGDISHIASLRNDNRKYEDAIKYVFHTSTRNEIYEDKVTTIYLSEIAEKALVFDGVEKVLRYLNALQKPWGIVTTKERAFVEAIIRKYRKLPQ